MERRIAAAGLDVHGIELECRGDVCRLVDRGAKDFSNRVHDFSISSRPMFAEVAYFFAGGSTTSVYYLLEREDLDAARFAFRDVVAAFHDSTALADCKAGATTHGEMFLHLQLAADRRPVVEVIGVLVGTAVAECVTAALLATIASRPFSDGIAILPKQAIYVDVR